MRTYPPIYRRLYFTVSALASITGHAGRLTPQGGTHLLQADQCPRGHVLDQCGRIDGIPDGNRPHVLPLPKLVRGNDLGKRK